jgi:hypothetical protein
VYLKSVYRLGFKLDNRGSIPGRYSEGNIFSSPPCPGRLWGPLSHLCNWYLGIKRTESQADHSPPSSVDVKNVCTYTSTPNTSSWHCTSLRERCFMAWCLFKHGVSFYLYLYLVMQVSSASSYILTPLSTPAVPTRHFHKTHTPEDQYTLHQLRYVEYYDASRINRTHKHVSTSNNKP